VCCRLSEIQSTPAQVHPVKTSGFEPTLIVTMHGVAETFKIVIEEMTFRTLFNISYLLQVESVSLPHKNFEPQYGYAEKLMQYPHCVV
jgi:hypothetical protein